MQGQLKRSISARCRKDRNVRSYYIGIASGDDVFKTLKRYDEFKKQAGVSEMRAIYVSSSEENSKRVETDVEEYYDRIAAEKKNRKRGGGGRSSSGPKYYVYIAFERGED